MCQTPSRGIATTPKEDVHDIESHNSSSSLECKEESERKEEEEEEEDDFHPDNKSTVPTVRRQKRRQRQRANAKIGRAIRRFAASGGTAATSAQRPNNRISSAHRQVALSQAQSAIVLYLDFVFGPNNLPFDESLQMCLDPVTRVAMVPTLLRFPAVQQALAVMGRIDEDIQAATVVDALKWSTVLRCQPVCFGEGAVVFCVKVKEFAVQDVYVMYCGICGHQFDPQFGYCYGCGYMSAAALMPPPPAAAQTR